MTRKISDVAFEEKNIVRKKMVKPARYKEIETGVRQIVKIRGLDGIERDEERPIYERVLLESVYVDEEKIEPLWVVTTEINGISERHEFSNESDALAYKESFQ